VSEKEKKEKEEKRKKRATQVLRRCLRQRLLGRSMISGLNR